MTAGEIGYGGRLQGQTEAQGYVVGIVATGNDLLHVVCAAQAKHQRPSTEGVVYLMLCLALKRNIIV